MDRLQAEGTLAADPELKASLLAVMGRVYQNLGLYARATPLVQQAVRYLGKSLELREDRREVRLRGARRDNGLQVGQPHGQRLFAVSERSFGALLCPSPDRSSWPSGRRM